VRGLTHRLDAPLQRDYLVVASHSGLRTASRPDQLRIEDGRHRNLLLEFDGGHAKAEAVSAFQRGAHGNIRDTEDRIKRA